MRGAASSARRHSLELGQCQCRFMVDIGQVVIVASAMADPFGVGSRSSARAIRASDRLPQRGCVALAPPSRQSMRQSPAAIAASAAISTTGRHSRRSSAMAGVRLRRIDGARRVRRAASRAARRSARRMASRNSACDFAGAVHGAPSAGQHLGAAQRQHGGIARRCSRRSLRRPGGGDRRGAHRRSARRPCGDSVASAAARRGGQCPRHGLALGARRRLDLSSSARRLARRATRVGHAPARSASAPARRNRRRT